MDEAEVERVRALSRQARFTHAIAMMRARKELWILRTPEGHLTLSGRGRRAFIPVWPDRRLAEAELDRYTDVVVESVPLARWLCEPSDFEIAVGPVGGAALTVPHAKLAKYLRGEIRDGVGKSPFLKRDTREPGDLIRYVSRDDVDIVLERVPAEYRSRVGDIHFQRSSDASVMGFVTTRGRRDITLTFALPIRVSLRRYIRREQRAEEYGAPARGQWPPWAVRRYLLYNTLLHEIGHLQVAEKRTRRGEKKFASEGLAQSFANELRRTLYSERFEHDDPVHNAPSDGERACLAVWERLDKDRRALLTRLVLEGRKVDNATRAMFEPLTVEQRAFLGRWL